MSESEKKDRMKKKWEKRMSATILSSRLMPKVKDSTIQYGSEQLEYGTSNIALPHELGSERANE